MAKESMATKSSNLSYKKEILKIVQHYIDKSNRCKELSVDEYEQTDTDDSESIYHFWDGFNNCAEVIYRRIKEL